MGYARAHLPVKFSRRSKKPFLTGGSVISKTRRKLSEPSLEFVDVPSCYDIPSNFEFFSPSQLQRPQSSWARSSGRSSRLDPNGQLHRISTHGMGLRRPPPGTGVLLVASGQVRQRRPESNRRPVERITERAHARVAPLA